MVLFNPSERIRGARFDITGRLVRRGIPVPMPGPLGASPETVDELSNAPVVSQHDAQEYVPGAAAELGEKLRAMESGIRDLRPPQLFIDSEEEGQRLYARSALLGILGGGYL